MIQQIIKNNELVNPISREMKGLREYFPQCFNNEGMFDIDKFREAIKQQIDVTREGRSYDFLGKSYARMLSSLDTTTVIRPDIEHNTKPENAESENIYISGDNLDALHHLVKSYTGEVKCIYIDPPYNTGTDGFVYNDKFKFTEEELEKKLSITPDEAEKIIAMTSGHRSSHAAWLTFMMPRLQLARDLLSKDGVIFISIDDNEQAYLKQLCDNIFGEDNFEGCVHYRRRSNQPNDKTKLIGLVAEHILVYAKNSAYLKSKGVGKISLTGSFSNPDKDIRGPWASKPWKVGSDQSGSRYTIIAPNGTILNEEWMGDEDTYLSLKNDNRIYFPKKGDGMPRKKYYLSERAEEGQCATNWWNWDMFGDNASANADLTELFGFKNAFSNPKNLKLIDAIIGLSNVKDGDIVLDFFGGSGTTAHAVLNYKKVANVKFILVQLPEDLDVLYNACSSASEKERLGNILKMLDECNNQHTLDYVGFERIKRAAKKIKEENPLFTGDLGFKHYTLEEVPQNTLDKLETFDPSIVLTTDDTLNLFGRETVLTTWMVQDGYGLNAPTKEIKLNQYRATLCGNHLYMTDCDFTEDDMVALIDYYQKEPWFNPDCIVLFGYSFGHNAKDMLEKNKTTIELIKDFKPIIDVRY